MKIVSTGLVQVIAEFVQTSCIEAKVPVSRLTGQVQLSQIGPLTTSYLKTRQSGDDSSGIRFPGMCSDLLLNHSPVAAAFASALSFDNLE
jgi:hypothetical protein